jgi:hypothetical protein
MNNEQDKSEMSIADANAVDQFSDIELLKFRRQEQNIIPSYTPINARTTLAIMHTSASV